MSTNKRTVLSLIGIFIVWAVISYALNLNQADTTTSANYNTKRNAALSGCENGDIPGYTKQQQANYCECYLTTMEKKYPDIFTNDNLLADKVKNGLSKEDTDLLVNKCIK
jgi:hypothetical protein